MQIMSQIVKNRSVFCANNPVFYSVCLLCGFWDVRFFRWCWHLVYRRCLLNAPSLFFTHIETGRWKPDVKVNHLTLEICIHIKGIEQAALCCYTRKPVELMRKGVQTKLEATRQHNKMLCFSSGSSNCTSSCLCLWLLGNWVALLSQCESSAAHYSSCWQRKRQQHQPAMFRVRSL